MAETSAIYHYRGESDEQVPRNVTHVRVDNSVTEIGERAFAECYALKEVELPEGLQKIGSYAFVCCRKLLRIKIPSTVVAIGDSAFQDCPSLKEVKLCEGLRRIRDGAFMGCSDLADINIPSSVGAIGDGAFVECSALKEVELYEGLQRIGEGAFGGCHNLLHINIPSTAAAIGSHAFFECSALKNVKLHEGLQTIGENAFEGCKSMLSVNIPSTVADIGNGAFLGCHLLRNISVSQSIAVGQQTFPTLQNVDCPIVELKGRFNEFPIHSLCCGQPQLSIDNFQRRLEEEINKHGTICLDQDCLGMTSLHCLACSDNYDLNLYKLLVENYPNALITQDKWGATPLEYAMLNEVPVGIICFLFQMHHNKWKEMPFGFDVVVEKLAKKGGTSADFLRCIIRAQRKYFSEVDHDWRRIVDQSVEDAVPFKVFLVLVEASVSKRMVCMSTEHQMEVMTTVDSLESRYGYDDGADGYEELQEMVTNYARMYKEYLKEATSILELAIWKNKLEDSRECSSQGRYNLRKKAKTSDHVSRGECRKACPAQVVIPNVLSFL